MLDKIRVAVIGACGRMGSEVVRTVCGAEDMCLVGACDVVDVGKDISTLIGVDCQQLVVQPDLASIFAESHADVVVDFAKPFNIANVEACVEHGAGVIIGTTGQTEQDLARLDELANKSKSAIMVIPNFAIGAVLMMMFAAQAAKYMPNVEIIELHHDKKLDSPSGTAIKTAQMISESREASGLSWERPLGADDPARGEKHCDINVHSVRLPGLVAHQEVIFGGTGQTLSIRHDSLDRTSFMPGVLLAIRKCAEGARGFVYGLDKLF